MKIVIVVKLGIRSFSAQEWSNQLSKDIPLENITIKRSNYHSVLTQLTLDRKKWRQAYEQGSSTEKARIVKTARKQLEKTLVEEVFPAWYGTQWDFNGISKTPGEGKIACGYFVSTCLTHIGYEVNRIRLAQQPSQRIIETFMPRSQRKILYGVSIAKVRQYLQDQGDGIYLVGLDRHVGFIAVQGENIAFIHSSYYRPNKEVISEPIDTKNPLSDSQYRVFGKLFSDDMITGWLSQRHYAVKRK